jgi:hypothetical protein
MVAIVPVYVDEASIVGVVLNDGFFGDLKPILVLEGAVSELEDLFSAFATKG